MKSITTATHLQLNYQNMEGRFILTN